MKIGLCIEKWLLVLCFFLLMYVDVASAVDPASMTVCILIEKWTIQRFDLNIQSSHKRYIANYAKEEENARAYGCFSHLILLLKLT